MAKITYTDKETLNEIPSIPAKNKVQASDMNEIKNAVNQNELKVLLIVDSSAPAECSTGDMYYNTTTKLIYTATGTNTWGSTGVNPTQNTLYIDSTNKSTYFYDGSDLISVGGGAGGESLKIGTIVPFAGSTIPDGYLTCDGTAVSRTTYSDLFAVIDTTYGAGDGSTTFNLPNLKGRVLVGLDGTDVDFDTIGKTLGSKELQEHYHEKLYWGNFNTEAGLNSGNTKLLKLSYEMGQTAKDNNFITGKAGTGDSGNIQPSLVTNFIIKATKTTPVQAEIVNEYSTSTTDGYSCNEVNNLVQDVYSTDEQVIGKWINNKPLYRKTIYSTSLTGNLSLSNIEFLRYKNFIAKVGNFIFPESRYVNENDNCNFFLNQSSLSYDFSVGSTWQGQVSYVAFDIEYTKTTD